MSRKAKRSRSGKKISNNLVALSSAAILTVYAAGYVRTRSAAERFAAPAGQRRAVPPAAAATLSPPVESPPVEVRQSAIENTPRNTEVRAPQPRRAPSIAPTKTVEAPPAKAESALSNQPLVTAVVAPAVPDSVQPTADTAVTQAPALAAQYMDGTFSAWGYSRHGDIQATVEVLGGKIVAAAITQCQTRYPCTWIEKLPDQVVSRQSPDVDYVSGATESAEAFYDAVFDALAKAR